MHGQAGLGTTPSFRGQTSVWTTVHTCAANAAFLEVASSNAASSDATFCSTAANRAWGMSKSLVRTEGSV